MRLKSTTKLRIQLAAHSNVANLRHCPASALQRELRGTPKYLVAQQLHLRNTELQSVLSSELQERLDVREETRARHCEDDDVVNTNQEALVQHGCIHRVHLVLVMDG